MNATIRAVLICATLVGGMATSAAAASQVFIVHGIPGVPVDVYASAAGTPVPGTATIATFRPKQVVRVDAPAGRFDIRIFAAGSNPQSASPVIEVLGATIPDNVELSIVAHLSADGTPTATIYRNDNGAVAQGWARVSVRHTAAAPAVALTAGGVPKLALTHALFGDLEVRAGTIPLQLVVPFSTTAITPTASLSFASGTRYFVYAIGAAANGSLDFIIHATP